MLLRAIYLALAILNSLDASCFVAETSNIPRIVIDKPVVASQSACEAACLANPNCLGIAHGSTCTLFSSELAGQTCAAPSVVYIKETNCGSTTSTATLATTLTTSAILQTTTTSTTTTSSPTSAPTTTTTVATTTTTTAKTIGAGMAGDPCGTMFDVIQLDTSPPCPRGSSYVIRGMDETGTTVTLDNDETKMITWDAAKQLWRYYYSTTVNIYLKAASCTIADNNPCDCNPLPKLDDSIKVGVAASINQSPVCPSASQSMWFTYPTKTGTQTWMGPTFTSNMSIRCRAGIWIAEYNDKSVGWQLSNATCF